MTCRKCGNQLIPGEKFCRICGEQVGQNNPVNQQTSSSIEILPAPLPENSYQQNNNIMCKLILHRKKAFVASMIKLDVLIDNQKMGTIKNGGTLEIMIPSGQHTVYFCRNNKLVSFNAQNIITFLIHGDATADVVILNPDSVGLTNINGEGDKYTYR